MTARSRGISLSHSRFSSGHNTAAGGTVAGPPQEIPGVGLHGSFLDTEGNRMSLLTPLAPASAPAT